MFIEVRDRGTLAESHESADDSDLAPSAVDPQIRFSFDAWVVSTMAGALAYATSLLRDPVAAEDVVQDCYLRIFNKAADYDLDRDGLAILRRSIANACINLTTREHPAISINSLTQANTGEGIENISPDVIDDAAADPMQVAISSELQELLDRGLAALPITQRAALELRCLGHSITEISDMLDLTASNVSVLIHRARVSMAKFLSAHWEKSS